MLPFAFVVWNSIILWNGCKWVLPNTFEQLLTAWKYGYRVQWENTLCDAISKEIKGSLNPSL